MVYMVYVLTRGHVERFGSIHQSLGRRVDSPRCLFVGDSKGVEQSAVPKRHCHAVANLPATNILPTLRIQVSSHRASDMIPHN